jgi:hypothetical protein
VQRELPRRCGRRGARAPRGCGPRVAFTTVPEQPARLTGAHSFGDRPCYQKKRIARSPPSRTSPRPAHIANPNPGTSAARVGRLDQTSPRHRPRRPRPISASRGPGRLDPPPRQREGRTRVKHGRRASRRSTGRELQAGRAARRPSRRSTRPRALLARAQPPGSRREVDRPRPAPDPSTSARSNTATVQPRARDVVERTAADSSEKTLISPRVRSTTRRTATRRRRRGSEVDPARPRTRLLGEGPAAPSASAAAAGRPGLAEGPRPRCSGDRRHARSPSASWPQPIRAGTVRRSAYPRAGRRPSAPGARCSRCQTLDDGWGASYVPGRKPGGAPPRGSAGRRPSLNAGQADAEPPLLHRRRLLHRP